MGATTTTWKWRGKTVPVTMLKSKPYMEVATKIALAWEDGGFTEVSHEFLTIGDKDVIRVCIEFKGNRFFGSAQIKWGGDNADATDPIENAETSAKGRALSAAGFQISSVASADDMERFANRTVDQEAPFKMEQRTGPVKVVNPKALPEPKATVPTIAEQCATLANSLHYTHDSFIDLCYQHKVNGKFDYEAVKAQLMQEAQTHNGHMEALHGALAAHPAD